jgi:D-aminoacyl-tRNA deacylase
MIALIQRVRYANVTIAGPNQESQEIARIGAGLLAFIAIERGDSAELIPKMLHKLLNYRVFSDAAGKMNCSLVQAGGGLLLVSQFTLAANTQTGLRPSFSGSAEPVLSKDLFERLVAAAKSQHPQVGSGEFGADMQVSLCNDGPVTFTLSAR